MAPKRGVADAVLTVRTGGTRGRAQRGPKPPWPCPAVRPAWAWSHLAVPPPTVQGRGGASPRGTTAVGHPPLGDSGAVGGGGGAWSRECGRCQCLRAPPHPSMSSRLFQPKRQGRVRGDFTSLRLFRLQTTQKRSVSREEKKAMQYRHLPYDEKKKVIATRDANH